MKQKLTKRFLEALTNDTGKPVFYWDTQTQGFGVKVTPTGTINFIAERHAQIDGERKNKRLTLGRYPEISLEDARKRAMDTLAKLRDGIDPVKERQLTHEAKRRERQVSEALSKTLGEVLDEYLTHRSLKPKTVYDYRNTFKNCFGDWLEKPIRSITRLGVQTRYFAIQKKGGRTANEKGLGQANKAMAYLNSVMEYAKADEIEGFRLIEDNPIEVLKAKRLKRALKPRTRIIPLEQIGVFLYSLDTSPTLDTKSRNLLKLHLYTGKRRNELLTLRWEHVHLDAPIPYFVIPDTKNGLDDYVPITAATKEVFEDLRAMRNDHHPDSPWVFPAYRGEGHYLDPRKRLEKFVREVGIEFTLHDLRRTFATAGEDIGISETQIKRALNHKNKTITERYIQTTLRRSVDTLEEVESYLWERGNEAFWEDQARQQIAEGESEDIA